MKPRLAWHRTRFGALALWLGGIELAVPVLILTAAALAVGTYLDSTKGAAAARTAVYGAWWFIALMGLVCVSLIFAVITRLPWQRRHVGFITVHAGLVGLITGGFVSMFGRVEGHLPLEEGSSSNVIQTQDEQLELVEHRAGQFAPIATVPGPRNPQTLKLGDVRVQVVERWENSREEQIVNDDAPEPFRGVQVTAQTGEMPIWVGEEGRAGAAPVLAGLTVRVLPEGATWEPPAKPERSSAGYVFVVAGQKVPLVEPGQDAFPGWKTVSVKRFTRAMVGSDGLIETSGGPENPAVEVEISDGQGTTERHTAFEAFTDLANSKATAGIAHSGAQLLPAANASFDETLVIFGKVSDTSVGYISPRGEARVLERAVAFPKVLELGERRVTLNRQFARARGGWKTLRADPAKENRPALVLRVGDATELMIIQFKGMAPLATAENPRMIRFVPRTVTLPFSVRLVEFHKTDYPGTEMAMAYESHVEVSLAEQGGENRLPRLISMNHPFAHGPWKVYQSGFFGDSVSIFSVMKDPGLPLTYISAAVLCVGILLTFFSRSLSWGHPGIPVATLSREQSHASPPVPAVDVRIVVGRPVGVGIE